MSLVKLAEYDEALCDLSNAIKGTTRLIDKLEKQLNEDPEKRYMDNYDKIHELVEMLDELRTLYIDLVNNQTFNLKLKRDKFDYVIFDIQTHTQKALETITKYTI